MAKRNVSRVDKFRLSALFMGAAVVFLLTALILNNSFSAHDLSPKTALAQVPLDANYTNFYFDGYDATKMVFRAWPENMVDGVLETAAYSGGERHNRTQYLDSNTCGSECVARQEEIYSVEVRLYGCSVIGNKKGNVLVRPYFKGEPSIEYVFNLNDPVANAPKGTVVRDCFPKDMRYTDYADITNAPGAPASWTWNDVGNLDLLITANKIGTPDYFKVGQVEIRVAYQ